MNRYYFELLGLVVMLQTPVPLTVSDRLQPFLCQMQNQVDCRIDLQVCENLPQPEGVWHGLECYYSGEDRLQTFYCHEAQGLPYAVTTIDSEGNVQIMVAPECITYFSGTSGIFNRIGFENLLLQHKGLLLHASLINFAGQGIAFTGPSGVGKSTQADLWKNLQGADILNGDRAALRKTEEGWFAYGSPYAGTSGIYRKGKAPVRAIVLLHQAKENRLQKLSGAEAFKGVWPELSLHRWDSGFVARAMELCESLLKDVPVYLLECMPDGSAVTLLKEGLSL